MITWFQTVLQKHYKWLFSILLVVIIVSFVFTIGATPTDYGSEVRAYKNDFYGVDLNNRLEMEHLSTGATISSAIQGLNFADGEAQNALFYRAIYLALADDMQFPEPREEDLIAYVQSLPIFQGSDGQYNPNTFKDVTAQILSNIPKLTENDIFNVLAEDFRIAAVRQALEGPGYVLPHEAMRQMQMNRIQWSCDVATRSLEDFEIEITPTEEELKAWFEEQSHRYERPARLRVSYAYVPAERFLETVELPKDVSRLESWYAQNRGRFPGHADFASARPEVEIEWRKTQARKKAQAFAHKEITYALYQKEIEYGSEPFKALLESLKLTTESLEPYSRRGLLTHELIPQSVLAKAFNQRKRYYSDPELVKDGVVVLFVEGEIPAELPPFDPTDQQVITDYTENKKRELFVESGGELHDAIATKVKSSEDFVRVAAEAGLSVQPYRDFSLNQPPGGINYNVLVALQALREGELSPMLMQGDNGLYVYLIKRDAPEINADDEELQSSIEQAMLYTSSLGLRSLIEEMHVRGKAMARGPEAEEAPAAQ